MDRATLLQSERSGRRTARWVLGKRTELGLSNLQLGRHDSRWLPVVDTSFPEHGELFRCLSHRPRVGFLPHLGNPGKCSARSFGTVCTCIGHEPRRSGGLRTALARGIVHRTVHYRLGIRPNFPRACQRSAREIHRKDVGQPIQDAP